MPRYATSLPMASAIKGVKCHGTRPAFLHGLAIKGVKFHGTRPAFLHGLAIKGVKSHGTRPASRHALAIKGVKCRDTRPAFPMVWRIRELNTTVPDQHDPMSRRLKG
nr:hypothetical protein [Escherichia coli]